MSEQKHDRSSDFEARHAAIIAWTLRWADEAAAREDYGQALRWVETLRELGDVLPDDYEAKQRRWRRVVEQSAKSSRPPGPPRWGHSGS